MITHAHSFDSPAPLPVDWGDRTIAIGTLSHTPTPPAGHHYRGRQLTIPPLTNLRHRHLHHSPILNITTSTTRQSLLPLSALVVFVRRRTVLLYYIVLHFSTLFHCSSCSGVRGVRGRVPNLTPHARTHAAQHIAKTITTKDYGSTTTTDEFFSKQHNICFIN